MADKRLKPVGQALEQNAPLIQFCLPIRASAGQFGFQIFPILFLRRIEKFKFEQIAQPVGFCPEHVGRDFILVFSRFEQRQFDNRLVEEMMDNRIAIIAGQRVFFGLYRINRTRSLIITKKQATIDQRINHLLKTYEVFFRQIVTEPDVPCFCPFDKKVDRSAQFISRHRAGRCSKQAEAHQRGESQWCRPIGLHRNFKGNF